MSRIRYVMQHLKILHTLYACPIFSPFTVHNMPEYEFGIQTAFGGPNITALLLDAHSMINMSTGDNQPGLLEALASVRSSIQVSTEVESACGLQYYKKRPKRFKFVLHWLTHCLPACILFVSILQILLAGGQIPSFCIMR